MPCVKIKQLEERIATSGVHLGGPPERRKLFPGEVLDIPEDFEAGMYGGKSLFAALWDTGKLEMTPEPATRPLEYASEREAQITAPTFKMQPHEAAEVERAFAAVAERLKATGTPEPETEMPEPEAKLPRSTEKKTASRRSARRAKVRANSEQTDTA